MIDLHTHSIFSDGELIPSELVRRSEAIGYRAVALTDHADSSNIDFIIPRLIRVAEDLNQAQSVKVVPGVELTHVPPGLIGPMIREARELGAAIVIVHGESIVEPVLEGTNRAGIEAGADILAHPGLITSGQAQMAAQNDIFLEISARSGHSLTNGHVARVAKETGARLVLNSDTHAPGDLMTRQFARKLVEGAGLPDVSLDDLLSNSRLLLEKIGFSLTT